MTHSSGQRMPRGFIRALGLVKGAAAGVNAELGHLPRTVAKAIQAAAAEVARALKAPGTVLMLRSLGNANRIDLGFDPRNGDV